MTQPTQAPIFAATNTSQSHTVNFGEALFSSKTSWALASISGFLVLFAVIMALYGAKPYDTSATLSHSYSSHVLGHRAWVEFLQQSQIHVLRVHSPQQLVSVGSPLFFLEPLLQPPKQHTIQALSSVLLQRLQKGRHSIVVLPKWQRTKTGHSPSTYQLRHARSVQTDMAKMLPASLSIPLVSQHSIVRKTPSPSSQNPAWFEQQVTWNGIQTTRVQLKMLDTQTFSIQDSSWRIWLGNRQQAWMISHVSPQGGTLFLISDPDLIHNFNIHRADHAAVSWAFIRDILKTDTILVDEVFHHQIKQFSLTEELGRFPRSLLIFHALALWILMAWAGIIRFGKPISLEQQRHHGPQEIIQITSWVIVCGSKPSRLAGRYVQKVLDDLADRLGLGHLHSPQKFEQIDEIASRRSIRPEAVELFQRASSLQQHPGSVLEAIRMAQRAWFFRHQLIHHHSP